MERSIAQRHDVGGAHHGPDVRDRVPGAGAQDERRRQRALVGYRGCGRGQVKRHHDRPALWGACDARQRQGDVHLERSGAQGRPDHHRLPHRGAGGGRDVDLQQDRQRQRSHGHIWRGHRLDQRHGIRGPRAGVGRVGRKRLPHGLAVVHAEGVDPPGVVCAVELQRGRGRERDADGEHLAGADDGEQRERDDGDQRDDGRDLGLLGDGADRHQPDPAGERDDRDVHGGGGVGFEHGGSGEDRVRAGGRQQRGLCRERQRRHGGGDDQRRPANPVQRRDPVRP